MGVGVCLLGTKTGVSTRLDNSDVVSHSSGGCESEIQVPADLVSSKALIVAWRGWSSLCVLVWSTACVG